MVRWSYDVMVRWSYDVMVRWSDNVMVRWSDYVMVRWSNDVTVAWCDNNYHCLFVTVFFLVSFVQHISLFRLSIQAMYLRTASSVVYRR